MDRVTPEYARCNLTANRADEIGFARRRAAAPLARDEIAGERSNFLSALSGRRRQKNWRDPGEGAGRDRWSRARDGPDRDSAFAGAGSRAAITEQFGLPYLWQRRNGDGSNTGPETGFGADCANFVYALRRQGRLVPCRTRSSCGSI
jgi:hypothetical protein